MKIVISPAKKLNYEEEEFSFTPSTITYHEESEYLIKKLKKLNIKKIADLMHLSQDLSELNYNRYQTWEYPFENGAKPAAFAFDGEVYNGLDIRSYSEEDLNYAQDNLRILSGLYGILKPLDNVLPYRLEMGTKFEVTPKTKNLYQYWKEKLTKDFKEELGEEVLVNLASIEYFKALDKKAITNTIITPTFKERKGDTYKPVMVYAKRARGLMSQFIIKNKISNLEDLKSFDTDGYIFNSDLSVETDWVFTRG